MIEGSDMLQSALNPQGAIMGNEEITSRLTHLKSTEDLSLKPVSLRDLKKWHFGESTLEHEN